MRSASRAPGLPQSMSTDSLVGVTMSVAAPPSTSTNQMSRPRGSAANDAEVKLTSTQSEQSKRCIGYLIQQAGRWRSDHDAVRAGFLQLKSAPGNEPQRHRDTERRGTED